MKNSRAYHRVANFRIFIIRGFCMFKSHVAVTRMQSIYYMECDVTKWVGSWHETLGLILEAYLEASEVH